MKKLILLTALAVSVSAQEVNKQFQHSIILTSPGGDKVVLESTDGPKLTVRWLSKPTNPFTSFSQTTVLAPSSSSMPQSGITYYTNGQGIVSAVGPYTAPFNGGISIYATNGDGAGGITSIADFTATNISFGVPISGSLTVSTLNINTLVVTNTATFSNNVAIIGTLTNTGIASFGGAVNHYGAVGNTSTVTNTGVATTAGAVTNYSTVSTIGASTNTGIASFAAAVTNYATLVNIGAVSNSSFVTTLGAVTNLSTESVSGLATFTNGVGFASSAFVNYLTNIVYTNVTLNFASTATLSFSDLLVNVTNLKSNDVATINAPAISQTNGIFSAWISNTVLYARYHNYAATAIDPASGIFNMTVMQYK